MTGKRLFIDTSKCIGCRACQVACKQWHSLQSEDTTFTGVYTNPPDMSGANLTVAKFKEVEDVGTGKLKFLFFKDQCRHCHDPSCKVACTTLGLGAIKKKPSGMVLIKPEICDPSLCSPGKEIKPCQEACPFKTDPVTRVGVPKRDYVKGGNPESTVMRKCDFCYNRFAYDFCHLTGTVDGINWDSIEASSKKPACMVTCPPGAIRVGGADKMLTVARRRARYLRANGYPNAQLYPAGFPSHVIWVLTEAPSAYGIVPA